MRGCSELGRLLETIESSEGLEVAAAERWEEAAQEECVLNTTDYAFLTLETMVAEVEPAPAVGMRRGAMCSLAPVLSPPPQEVSRRCTHCASEKASKWRQGLDDPGTLCNACSQRLLQTNSSHCRGSRSSRMENSAAGNDVAALVEALPCGLDASLDAFFDQMVSEVSWEEAGPGRAAEEELEWFSNKDAFPSMETMALEVEVEEPWALETPRARTNGQQHVTAMETTCRQANVPRAKQETTAMQPVLSQRRRSRCTHCATENTPEWRQGPEGPHTLCNACGMVFRRKGHLLAEYRPANSPAFSPLLHSSTYARALKMHLQNETSAIGEMHVKLMDPPPPAKVPTSSVRPRPPRRRPRPCVGDRRCTRCATEKTPQWREGPEGPRTLCNACGMVFKNRGRLLPEYRPANSPAFSPLLHSSRYRRALEMHRQNETTSAAYHGEVHSVPMDGQLLPPANGPTSSSSLPPRLVLGEGAFTVIRANAEARHAERAAAFLTAMDN